ncbi:MAG: chromosome segregation protein SMC, partial [Clostridia bacterium]|nr:chromosome segregation protein SMC [Clostridia bacterium]
MLYLKKIEMYGFKSFADKVELRFDQPITGIVGPNGCGKSNISDAIRWVLGEQSTKTLRGKVMQDLIFSGTDARKSMSYCEVSLFIDNSTRLFPIQMDEVIISRKLYRNNESEYLLNRNICRLRDIQELLRGVGLGKEGYSIVGQGRMDAILNARPEDRRAIFEEALGISSFRVKKVETERKLEKTRGNMQNIMILVEELKRRLPELKRQSTNAHKYLNLYNELRLLEINAYIYGYDHASQDKANGKKKLDGLKEQLALKERLYVEFNEQYDALFQRRNSIDDEINTLRERQLKLAVAQAENEGQQRLHQERIANLQHDIEQSEETITASQNEIDSITQAIAELDDQIAKRLQEKEQLENEILQVTENFVSLGGKLDEINSDADALRKKLEDILAAVSQYSSKLAAGNTEKDTLNQRLQEIADKEAEVSLKLKQSAGEEGNLLEQYDILRKQKDQQESDARILKQKVKELEYKQFELAKELQRRQQAFASEKGGIDMLKDFAANYRGFQVSVQYLMQDSQKDKELASHICGVVANLLKVEPKLQLAIETALGARLQNIVTLNEEDVKYLINYLKINDYGKATFLPVSSMKPHTIVRPEVLNEKGVLGVASKLVSFDKKYFTVFESLLGGIVIVDNFDNAVAISRKYGYSHRMVTLTGERINNDGSLEGGSNKKQTTTNLLGYESEIEKRTETLERLRAELNKTEQEKLALDKQLEQLRSEHAQLLDSINSLNVQIATAKEKIETSNTLSNSDKQTILGLSTEKERINTRIMEIDRAITKITAHLDELSKAEKKLRSKIDHNRETLQLESSAKDLLAQSINQKRYRLAVLANNIESAQKEKEALAHQIVSLQDAIEGKNRYIGQVRQAIDLLMEELNASTEDSALRDELTQLSQQIKQADQLRTQLEVDFQRMTDERISLSNEL